MRLPNLLLAAAMPAVLLTACSTVAGDVAELEITGARSPRIPGMQAAAVYMELHNRSTGPLTIIGVDSTSAATVNLHRTVTDEHGRHVMRPAEDGLEVPAGGMLALREGGDHVMLVDLQPYRIGDVVEVILDVQGESVTVEVPITELAP